MNIGGVNYTGFNAVNLKGSVGVRFAGEGCGATLRASLGEGLNRDYVFPDKSGTFPVMGTFAVQLPAVAATTYLFSTIVTVTGIRAEDGLIVQFNKGVSAGYGFAASTGRILVAAEPGNGNITLTINNPGVATAASELVCSYVAVR